MWFKNAYVHSQAAGIPSDRGRDGAVPAVPGQQRRHGADLRRRRRPALRSLPQDHDLCGAGGETYISKHQITTDYLGV